MALMFPWATKEYLLWEMTIGQIIMYHNKAIDIQNGSNEQSEGLTNKSPQELRKIRDDMREMQKQIKAQEELERSNSIKEQYKSKYGDI